MNRANPFILICPATRGLSLALTRHYLRTTNLPVYATHRSGKPEAISNDILAPLKHVDPKRLSLLHLNLENEQSISSAAQQLSDSLPKDADSFLHTAFFTGGILHPEKQPADLDAASLIQAFQINVISHLLLIKHLSTFLPTSHTLASAPSNSLNGGLARWVHVSARVGSVLDNKTGGWYSYRASKSALNQVVKTFDLQLQMKKIPAMCVGVHPGTVKTDLSKRYWGGVPEGKLFEPEYAAEKLSGVVAGLEEKQRGRIWDWAGKEIVP
ncbi:NAD-P-binding protein [Stereum hirsutum FP-91666 SS1]|uniref:NAD-P-binding protein n=1 Tax=Stereum hirsutum (strain FP-91666) TaxID=721885 RepID=UPI000440F284|nr:NAD-P-binding protein [Stereum hirsutum FP-91666 SS1]EIM88195.1 NAD-P-binding protein [Stereum hirsutum FP-91666 SS1]